MEWLRDQERTAVALTELKGSELGSQTITIEQGPVRAFAEVGAR